MSVEKNILLITAASIAFFHTLLGLITVTSVFAVVTVGTMMSIVPVSYMGINLLPLSKTERYVHAIAGGRVFISGLSIQLPGL